MIVRDLDGNLIDWKLNGFQATKAAKSELHLSTRVLLYDIYKTATILEEVTVSRRGGDSKPLTETFVSTIGSTLPFWAIAATLVAAATALVCIPLFKGRSRGVATLLAVLLPAAAVGVYLLVGSPTTNVEAAAPQTPSTQAAAAEAPAGHFEQDIEKLIGDQKAHLGKNPEDAAAWAALGVTYAGLDRWKEAEEAFAKDYALQPKEALIVSAYAEALAINAGRDLSGRPIQLVREALELAAQDPKALELAAINAFQGQEYTKAAYYFRHLLKVLSEDSSYAQDVQEAMREAKRRAEEAAYGAPLDNRPPTDDVHSIAKGTISGTVELDPALAGKVTGRVLVADRPAPGARVAGIPWESPYDEARRQALDAAYSQTNNRYPLCLSIFLLLFPVFK